MTEKPANFMDFSIFEKKIYCSINQIKVSRKKLICCNFVSDSDRYAKYYISADRIHISPLDILIEGRTCSRGHLADSALILRIGETALYNFYYGITGRGLYSNENTKYFNFGCTIRREYL